MRISPQRVKQARHKAGFTQDQLARAAGVSVRNIVRWEHTNPANGAQPRAENIAAIAAATGQEITFFFASEDEEEEEPDMATEPIHLFARGLELMMNNALKANGAAGTRSLRGLVQPRTKA